MKIDSRVCFLSKSHCAVKVGLIFIHVLLKNVTWSTISDDIVLQLIRGGFAARPQSDLLQTQEPVPGDILQDDTAGLPG